VSFGFKPACGDGDATVRKYIIMGVQGCGKGTQAKMLAKDFDLVHISAGRILPGEL
jgi:adenylate kinase